jgi:bacterioferritin-associated ferredoxin
MIVCSCNILSDCKIKTCLHSMDNPTVSAIFRELEAQPQCATCIQTIVRLLQEHKDSQKPE